MNQAIAIHRKDSVLKADNITISQGDFLATHVAMKNLQLLDTFIYEPNTGKEYDETVLLEKFVINPENRHQLVVIYGGSGTGKSHLIRWLAAKFEQVKSADEVVLFIRRSDNTLKGTIAQLLAKPEIQEIQNRDVYDRLFKASVVLDDAKLKDTIFHNFIIQIENDDSIFNEFELSKLIRDRLVAFLNNSYVRKRMLAFDGPIERIYTKVAEHVLPDIDVIAEFKTTDFEVDSALLDSLSSADAKAKSLARQLAGKEELRILIANYLNRFVSTVIQTCTGIQPGDFRKVFQDIRRELKKLGKNLTLFIEDITSFTGLDESLLDALIVEHQGMQEESGMCRISSFVGTTSDYLNYNFRSNHKDRVTKYVYIKDNVFAAEQIYEFVGKYVNTISLEEDVITEWLKADASDIDYPVHQLSEGKEWETVDLPYAKQLCLYPFTRSCIDYLCKYELPDKKQTPRYIIRHIIAPVVNDILENANSFPSNRFKLYSTDSSLDYALMQQVKDTQERDRLKRFLMIWGNGKNEEFVQDGQCYKAGIKEIILKDLNMPDVNFGQVQVPITPPAKNGASTPSSTNNQNTSTKSKIQTTNTIEIPKNKQNLVAEVNTALTEWQNGKIIDLSTTVGTYGTIKRAIDDFCTYLFSSINWVTSGISDDYRDKIKDSSKKLVKLENQKKGDAFYEMSCSDSISIFVIEAFVRWRIYGGQSWNYPGADFDIYFVTLWTYGNKAKIINAVKAELASQTSSYIEAATACLLIGNILQAAYREKKSLKFDIASLFWASSSVWNKDNNQHCSDWNKLVEFVKNGKESTVFETVKKYYNLPMGQGGSVIVLDELSMNKMLKKVLHNNLELDIDENNLGNIKQVKDIFKYYIDLKTRVSKVVENEMEILANCVQDIKKHIEIDDLEVDDLEDLLGEIGDFYKKAEEGNFKVSNGRSPLEKYVKQNKSNIVQAIATYTELKDGNNDSIVLKLLRLSNDPVMYLKKFATLLEVVAKHASAIDDESSKRIQDAESTIRSISVNGYGDDLLRIQNSIQILDTIGGKI